MAVREGSLGRSTNNLFEWMRREGAVPSGIAEWDWVELPKLIKNGQVKWYQVEQARAAIAACFAGYTKRELMEIASAEGILLSPAFTMAEVRENPHLNARGLFETLDENGRQRTFPGRFALTSIPSHAPTISAPRLGEHNDDVYGSGLGLAPERIAQLKQNGVI